MYNYIKGVIAAKENINNQNCLTVEAGGIGYAVAPTAALFDGVSVGELTTVHTFLSIREDAHILYGFVGREERALFLQLTGVSGIGAKTAIGMLSLGVAVLASAIIANDISVIASCKGISRKTAEKVVLELRDKVIAPLLSASDARRFSHMSSEVEDAIAGLVGLGLTKNNALELVKSVAVKGLSAEEIIVAALSKRGRA